MEPAKRSNTMTSYRARARSLLRNDIDVCTRMFDTTDLISEYVEALKLFPIIRLYCVELQVRNT